MNTATDAARQSGPAEETIENRNLRRVRRGNALAEALGYVSAWQGKRVVIKFGGRPMAEGAHGTLVRDVARLLHAGVRPILVHGGGPEISELLHKLDVPARFIDGLRVTDEPTMKVVEMVLAGHINKRLVGQLQAHGAKAVGLSGKDGQILQATTHPRSELGAVGLVQRVETALLETLLDGGFVPVIASLAGGPGGETLNVNADTAAAAIAVALGAEKFILLTDVDGIYAPSTSTSTSAGTAESAPTGAAAPEGIAGELVSQLEPKQALKLLEKGVVQKGMIPKLEACLTAVERGVPSAHIISARTEGALLLELLTEEGIGTMIRGGGWAAKPFPVGVE